MSIRARTAKGSILILAGSGVSTACSLIRNVILARILTKADFGIAASLGMVLSLFELTAKLGMARFVVQDKQGNDPLFVCAAHLVQGVVGIVGAALILLASGPLAGIFDIPNQAWALAALALVALCRGFEHVDVRRFERNMRFGPSTAVEAIPQFLTTLAAWPVAEGLGDFRAVLVLLVAKAALSCLLSHILAERPYRIRWNGEFCRRMGRFGWPLLLNGFLLFVVLQGDQFLVATFYTMEDLGPYAAAAALTFGPMFVLGNLFSSVFLPILSRVQDDAVGMLRRYRQIVALITFCSATSCAAIIVGAESVMRLVYGLKYQGSGAIMAWLAAATALRNLRVAPALAALARGDTQNQLISNLYRVMAFLPGVWVAVNGGPVWMLAVTGVFGEAAACWVSFIRLRRRDGVPLSVSVVPAIWLLMILGGAGLVAWLGSLHWPASWALFAALGMALCSALICVGVLAELRLEVRVAHRSYGVAGWRGVAASLKGMPPLVRR